MKNFIFGFILHTCYVSSQEIENNYEDFQNLLQRRIAEYQEKCNRPTISQIDRAICFGKLDSYLECWVYFHPDDYQDLK